MLVRVIDARFGADSFLRRAGGFCKLALTLGATDRRRAGEASLLEERRTGSQLKACKNIKINAVLTPRAGPTFLISA